MKKVMVNDKAQLDELKEGSALTWEGLDVSDESLTQMFDWIKEYTSLKRETVYITSGAMMNQAYGLTDDNAYPDDLNLVSVKLEDLANPAAIVIPRFAVGGRWFDDIVDNRCREEDE